MSSGVFGDDIESSLLYGVDCFGNETDILSCSLSTIGVTAQHSASVICQSMQLCVVKHFGSFSHFMCRS